MLRTRLLLLLFALTMLLRLVFPVWLLAMLILLWNFSLPMVASSSCFSSSSPDSDSAEPSSCSSVRYCCATMASTEASIPPTTTGH